MEQESTPPRRGREGPHGRVCSDEEGREAAGGALAWSGLAVQSSQDLLLWKRATRLPLPGPGRHITEWRAVVPASLGVSEARAGPSEERGASAAWGGSRGSYVGYGTKVTGKVLVGARGTALPRAGGQQATGISEGKVASRKSPHSAWASGLRGRD